MDDDTLLIPQERGLGFNEVDVLATWVKRAERCE